MKRILSGLALLLTLSAYNPAPGTADTCAIRLGIHYSADDGVTERLDAFARCTGA